MPSSRWYYLQRKLCFVLTLHKLWCIRVCVACSSSHSRYYNIFFLFSISFSLHMLLAGVHWNDTVAVGRVNVYRLLEITIWNAGTLYDHIGCYHNADTINNDDIDDCDDRTKIDVSSSSFFLLQSSWSGCVLIHRRRCRPFNFWQSCIIVLGTEPNGTNERTTIKISRMLPLSFQPNEFGSLSHASTCLPCSPADFLCFLNQFFVALVPIRYCVIRMHTTGIFQRCCGSCTKISYEKWSSR